jgi:RHS repeat-associated protein
VVADDKFTYDVSDRRIGKQVLGGQTTWTAYDGDNPYGDVNPDGTVYRYLYGPGLDEIYARLALGQQQPVTWYLTDLLGSVRQVATIDGSVKDTLVYDSFGNIKNESQPTQGDRFKYTGREWDAELSQYDYRARPYFAFAGRFEREDPSGFNAGDTNLYRFVFNQPLTNIDPTGLDVIYLFDPTSRNRIASALDKEFGNYGHGAVLIGRDKIGGKGGWTYYSFSTGTSNLTTKDNLETKTFNTLKDAIKGLGKYNKGGYIWWKTGEGADKKAMAAAEKYRNTIWHPGHNCDDLSASAIRAAGIPFLQIHERIGNRPNIAFITGALGSIGGVINDIKVSLPKRTYVLNVIGSQLLCGTSKYPLLTPTARSGQWPP